MQATTATNMVCNVYLPVTHFVKMQLFSLLMCACLFYAGVLCWMFVLMEAHKTGIGKCNYVLCANWIKYKSFLMASHIMLLSLSTSLLLMNNGPCEKRYVNPGSLVSYMLLIYFAFARIPINVSIISLYSYSLRCR